MKKLLIAAVAALGFAGFASSAFAISVTTTSGGSVGAAAGGDGSTAAAAITYAVTGPIVPPNSGFNVETGLDDVSKFYEVTATFDLLYTSNRITATINEPLDFLTVSLEVYDSGLGLIDSRSYDQSSATAAADLAAFEALFEPAGFGGGGLVFGDSGLITVVLKFSTTSDAIELKGSDIDVSISSIPVPASIVLFLTGLAGLGFMGRRRDS